jgi:hypothetical protein
MMKNLRIFRVLVAVGIFLGSAMYSVGWAQYPPGVKEMLAGSKAPAMLKLTGLVRVKKEYGVVPMGPGHKEAAVYPCMPFGIAVYDATASRSKPIVVYSELMNPGRETPDSYTCKYELMVPANRRLYVIPVTGGTLLLPKEDRSPQFITDAWIGGTNNKPRRGWERGFVGKYVTLTHPGGMYLAFDMSYAQVDPN